MASFKSLLECVIGYAYARKSGGDSQQPNFHSPSKHAAPQQTAHSHPHLAKETVGRNLPIVWLFHALDWPILHTFLPSFDAVSERLSGGCFRIAMKGTL